MKNQIQDAMGETKEAQMKGIQGVWPEESSSSQTPKGVFKLMKGWKQGAPLPKEKGGITCVINGVAAIVPEGTTLFEATQTFGAYVPTLCHHPRLKPAGKCGVCVVSTKISNERTKFQLSCSTKVKHGMKISTTSAKVKAAQNKALNSFLNANLTVNNTPAFTNSEINDLLKYKDEEMSFDDSGPSLTRNMNLCVGCTRCVRACSDLQDMGVLKPRNTPLQPPVITQSELALYDTECLSCGQCSLFCPTGAIVERDDTPQVLAALKDPKKTVILQTAPAVRVAIGECFGEAPGSVSTGKMVAAAKKIGFKHVFDTNFASDVCIMEEGTEFLERLKSGGPFPMFTSCCPGWINLAEKKYPKLLQNISSCRSPQLMMASLVKEYWAQKKKVKPEDIFLVSVMPCTAKKDEIIRPELRIPSVKGQTIDVVLTTREFAKLIKVREKESRKEKKEIKIDWLNMKDEKYDDPLGADTGASAIFGVTGGVMEAALRTAYEVQTGKTLPSVDFKDCRGGKGIKTATIDVDGTPINIAVVHGGKNAQKILNEISEEGKIPTLGKKDYHFIEIMCCPGGCIGGGGQPHSMDPNVLEKRAAGIYSIDEKHIIRKSHENKKMMELYKKKGWLGKPLGHKSHEVLHCKYNPQIMDGTTYREAMERRKTIIGTSTGFAGVQGVVKPGDGYLIAYGTQSGNSEGKARILQSTLMRALRKMPLNVFQVVSLNDITIDRLASEKNVFVICSTYGEGEFPESASAFWEKIKNVSDKNKLKNVNYGICGIGSTTYDPNFCKAAELIDKRFKELGGNQMFDIIKCDEKKPTDSETAFDTYCDNIVKAVGGSSDSLNQPHPPLWAVSIALSIGKPSKGKGLCAPGYRFVPLKKTELITPIGYDRDAKYFEIDLKDSGLSYTTGDHVAILPHNPEDKVKDFLDFYVLQHTQPVTIFPLVDNPEVEIPSHLTVYELFSQYLDLFAPVSRAFLHELALNTTDEEDKKELLTLSDKENQKAFKEFAKDNTYDSTLRKFESALPPVPALMTIVPFIKPRLYSIASSALLHPDTLQLSIVRFPGGLTTEKYLWNMKEGDSLSIKIKDGILVPPTNHEKPCVLFGLGTGIAAFRAFVQERRAMKNDGKRLGTCHLYFGCRHESMDYFFKNEWEEAVLDGVLTEVHMQFSHDKQEELGRLVFITEKMENESEITANIFDSPGVCSYYCGPAMGIPESICKVIEKSLKKHKGERADEIYKEFKKNFYVECF